VVVPTYNHENYILEAIESIARQSLISDCLVVVSDDCSNDSTFNIAKKAAGLRKNFVVQRNANNIGVMPHYQKLVERLETPFTAFLEGDDIWLSNTRLEALRDILIRNSTIAMCFSACIVQFESSGQRTHRPPWNSGRNRLVHIMDLIYENPIVTFSNCIYRTPDLKRAILGPDSAMGYDWLCNMKIALMADIAFVAEPSTLYRVHSFGHWSKLTEEKQNVLKLQSLKALLQCSPPNLHPYIRAAIEDLL